MVGNPVRRRNLQALDEGARLLLGSGRTFRCMRAAHYRHGDGAKQAYADALQISGSEGHLAKQR